MQTCTLTHAVGASQVQGGCVRRCCAPTMHPNNWRQRAPMSAASGSNAVPTSMTNARLSASTTPMMATHLRSGRVGRAG